MSDSTGSGGCAGVACGLSASHDDLAHSSAYILDVCLAEHAEAAALPSTAYAPAANVMTRRIANTSSVITHTHLHPPPAHAQYNIGLRPLLPQLQLRPQVFWAPAARTRVLWACIPTCSSSA